MKNEELRSRSKSLFFTRNSSFEILHSLLIALIALALFLPALIKQEVFSLRDHLDYFQPLRWFTAQELKQGHLPFWNPYSASGEAWLANPQTGVFYPPAWLFVVLPFETAYVLFLLLHVVLLGWGAYLFFARRASRGAALVGATALMLSGPVLSLLDISNNLATFAWIPLALWCAAERAPVRGGFALALAFLGGEPFFAAVAALLYAIVSRRAREILAAAAVAIGVSAIQLFPFLELLAGSDRAAGMDAQFVLRDSMPLRDWLRVAIPPSTSGAYDPALGQHFIPIVYMGGLVVALALIGVTRIRAASGWLALLGAAIVVAAGPSFLLAMPLTLFRYPARVVPLAALAVAALAVLGWDRIRRDRRWLDLLVVLVVVADLVPRIRPLLVTAPFRRDIVPYPRELGRDSKFLRVGEPDAAQRALWISGYLNLYDRRFDAYTAAPIASEAYLRYHEKLVTRPSRAEIDSLPTGWVLTTETLPPTFERVARRGSVNVYRNPRARPMAALVTRRGIVAAKWEISTSHARVVVDAPEEGVLVLAQQDGPGWRVTVDGAEREKQRIFGLFRAVSLPAGRHEVLWTYRPRSFFAGLSVTILTLLATQIFSFVKRRKREKIFSLSLDS